jgi:hypothetical protein
MRTLSDTFSVELERSNGATHLRLAGRFDIAATALLDDAIAVIRRRDVVLDLEAVTFMDGAAWLAIMAYEHRVHDWGMKFGWCVCRRPSEGSSSSPRPSTCSPNRSRMND